MHKILITGASGFLGSHIAETLVNNNYNVIALKRKQTDCWRCKDFFNKIEWVDIDEEGMWKKKIVESNPDTLIHTAWIGVEAHERDDWDVQIKNINFLTELLTLGLKSNIKRMINLGSQAEYGILNDIADEDDVVSPVTAYGATKIACLSIFKTFCELNNINWIWLRLFSFFGERESNSWLIPSVINKMRLSKQMDLTAAQQKYAYMYVQDFNRIMLKLLDIKIPSGVYNISGDQIISIKDLITKIKDRINPNFILNFGAVPYRKNQSMFIQGDMAKLTLQIGKAQFTEFSVALEATINYFTSIKADKK